MIAIGWRCVSANNRLQLTALCATVEPRRCDTLSYPQIN
jgi:hypothetical protein